MLPSLIGNHNRDTHNMDITVGQAQVKLSLMRSVSLKIYTSTFFSFITGVVDTADKPLFGIF
jgi:hypothetical protein